MKANKLFVSVSAGVLVIGLVCAIKGESVPAYFCGVFGMGGLLNELFIQPAAYFLERYQRDLESRDED